MKIRTRLVFNFAPDLLERLFLGLCERQLGGDGVALRDQGLLFLLCQVKLSMDSVQLEIRSPIS